MSKYTFIEAIEMGLLTEAEEMLKNMSPEELRLNNNFSMRNALHIATWKGHEDLAIKIIHKAEKITINATDLINCTPLHYAAGFGRLKVCKELLPHMTVEEINIWNHDGGFTALDSALYARHEEVYNFLVKNKAELSLFKGATSEGIKSWFKYGDTESEETNDKSLAEKEDLAPNKHLDEDDYIVPLKGLDS